LEAVKGLAALSLCWKFPFGNCARGRITHYGRRFHHRYSGVEQLGRTAAGGTRIYTRGTHPGEYIEKKQLMEAVDLYAGIAKKLLAS